MSISPAHYEINGLQIDWGRPFNEVVALVEHFEKFKPYQGWANLRCKCSNVFGLAATECELRAPFPDRPVLQVQYELSPVAPSIFGKRHSPFLHQLKKILGVPAEETSLYSQHRLPKNYISSAVVYSVRWMVEDVRISLSVYGGTRTNDSGDAAAGIFLDWTNEKAAAKPFREKAKRVEDFLSSQITETTPLQTFRLLQDQRPFSVVHFELKDPYVAEKDPEWRAAQMALYKRALYQTPRHVQNRLPANEVALCSLSGLSKVVVCNKWDTVCLESNDDAPVIFCEVLPARGPGGRELRVKELLIADSRDSDSLIKLADELEAKTGVKIERRETYDD